MNVSIVVVNKHIRVDLLEHVLLGETHAAVAHEIADNDMVDQIREVHLDPLPRHRLNFLPIICRCVDHAMTRSDDADVEFRV